MRVQPPLIPGEHAAESQIGNLELSLRTDEEVGGFEVPVHDAVLVQVRGALDGVTSLAQIFSDMARYINRHLE